MSVSTLQRPIQTGWSETLAVRVPACSDFSEAVSLGHITAWQCDCFRCSSDVRSLRNDGTLPSVRQGDRTPTKNVASELEEQSSMIIEGKPLELSTPAQADTRKQQAAFAMNELADSSLTVRATKRSTSPMKIRERTHNDNSDRTAHNKSLTQGLTDKSVLSGASGKRRQ